MKTNLLSFSLLIILFSPVFAQHTGVSYYGGSYHFDTLHVDAAGFVRNSSGCEIYFAGSENGSMATGSTSKVDSVHIRDMKNNMTVNVVRMEINNRWWVNDVPVPVRGGKN